MFFNFIPLKYETSVSLDVNPLLGTCEQDEANKGAPASTGKFGHRKFNVKSFHSVFHNSLRPSNLIFHFPQN